MSKDNIIRYAYYGLIVVLAIVGFVMILNGGSTNPKVDLALWQGIIYALVGTGIALVFALIGLVTHFKANLKNLIAFAVLIIAFFIFKGLAPTDVPMQFADKGVTSGMMRASQAGIMVSFFLIIVAIVLTIASGVRKLFN